MGFLLFLVVLFLFLAGVFFTVGLHRTAPTNKYSEGGLATKLNFKGVPFFLASFILFLLWMSWVTVDTGSIGVIKRWGKVVGQLEPGAHFIRPLVENVVPVVVQSRIVKPSESAGSHDMQVVHTEVTLRYHVDPKWAWYVLAQLNDDAEVRVITPAILEAIKSQTAKYDAAQLITDRPKVRDGIEDMVKEVIGKEHIIAETVAITDLNFSKEYNDAIEKKVTAQQHAEQAQNDLTRIKIEADQQIAQARGEAEALRAQREQITPELLQLRTIEMMGKKWDGKLPDTIVGGSAALPMMDVLTTHAKKQ